MKGKHGFNPNQCCYPFSDRDIFIFSEACQIFKSIHDTALKQRE